MPEDEREEIRIQYPNDSEFMSDEDLDAFMADDEEGTEADADDDGE